MTTLGSGPRSVSTVTSGAAFAATHRGAGPPPNSTSIYPTAACTGGTNCAGSDVICDCVSSQWANCRITTCPSSSTGHPYACMSGVTLPPNCSCKEVMPATQNVPYCVCNQT